MGKNAGHVLTYKNTGKDPEDVRRVQEIEANLQTKSLNSFPANPDVKQLLDRQLAVVDDGTDRYIVIRIGDSLLRINLTNTGDFVQVEGDTMTGQLTSEVASGAPPFVVTSTDLNVNLNADQVDGFDHDQSLLTTDSPTFVTVTLSGLTASRIVATDGSKAIISVAALTAWVAGTANQITITDDGDGTITISTPQDIHTGASPTFAGLTLSGLTDSRLMATDGAKAAASVAALTSWIAGTVNQITVTDDGDGTVTLSLPQNIHTGAAPTFAGITITGNVKLPPQTITDADSPFSIGAITNLLCDTTDGAITVNLPASSGIAGTEYRIKNSGASGNNVTLDGNASETIDDALTWTLIDKEALSIFTDGSNWHIW